MTPNISSLPDALGPLTGYRMWNTTRGLSAAGDSSYVWTTTTTKAMCRWSDANNTDWQTLTSRAMSELAFASPGAVVAEHEVPHERCSCGLYAAKTPDDLLPPPERDFNNAVTPMLFDAIRDGAFVVGLAKLWGRVIPHERGYRAEYAQPLGLFELWKDVLGPTLLAETLIEDVPGIVSQDRIVLDVAPPVNVQLIQRDYQLPILPLPHEWLWLREVTRGS